MTEVAVLGTRFRAIQHGADHRLRGITDIERIVRLLHRGLHDRRHCEHRCGAFTGGMRHFRALFLRAPLPPGLLTGGVLPRAVAAALITRTHLLPRLTPVDLGALPGAVRLSAIALPAHADGYLAPLTVVETRVPLAHPPAFPHSTGQRPCEAGIKDPRNRLAQASVNRGPGV
jgi:hypothetical protein